MTTEYAPILRLCTNENEALKAQRTGSHNLTLTAMSPDRQDEVEVNLSWKEAHQLALFLIEALAEMSR